MSIHKKEIDRRNFIKSALAGAGSIYLGSGSLSPVMAANAVNQNIVTIFLRGGHDALSSVAPKNATLLARKRPNIKYTMRNVGDSFFGVNNEFNSDFFSLFDDEDLAIIHGVGGLNPTTSHFAQMDYIEGGDSKEYSTQDFYNAFLRILVFLMPLLLNLKFPHLLGVEIAT